MTRLTSKRWRQWSKARYKRFRVRGTTRYREEMLPKRTHYRAHPEQIPAHEHGTLRGYRFYGCDCARCLTTWAKHCAHLKDVRAAKPIPAHVHGTPNGYVNYRCREACCRRAWNDYKKQRATA